MQIDANGTAAGIVVCVSNLDHVLDFLTSEIGFRVEKIFPADDPDRCTLVGFGTRLHLEPGTPQPTVLRLEVTDRDLLDGGAVTGPDGLRVEFVDASPPLHVPPLVSAFSLTHTADSWHTGRAGMHYRDLVPDRQGGAVIASHIRIPGAGPVPDYVHFHEIVFQLIFCRRGCVKVVYEDQGEPFVLEAGDCVTQPPRIRHRVLESTDDLEVIEIGYPAEHITRADPSTSLPTALVDRDRTWDEQTFVRHRRANATTTRIADGITTLDTGVSAGTRGLADVTQIDVEASTWACPRAADREFVLVFVLDGDGVAAVEGPTENLESPLTSGSTLVVPVGHRSRVSTSSTMSLLHVRIATV